MKTKNYLKPLLCWLLITAFGLVSIAQKMRPVQHELDRTNIPIIQKPFTGKTSIRTKNPRLYFPIEVKAPKGAPNILLIMPDDVGFGAGTAFGGPVPTVALDRIANAGIRYNAFHMTAICSPTRAALLTGRNHHSVATGVIISAWEEILMWC